MKNFFSLLLVLFSVASFVLLVEIRDILLNIEGAENAIACVVTQGCPPAKSQE